MPTNFVSRNNDIIALDRRLAGETYSAIAEVLGFNQPAHARAACIREARRVYGSTEILGITIRSNRTTPSQATSARRFGIEIEFNRGSGSWGQHNEIVSYLQERGIDAERESYNHNTVAHWKMTTDATVSGGELVSPIMSGSTESIDEVREALRAVKSAGGSTGRRVGMHVHIDVTDFQRDDMLRLVRNLRIAERPVASFVPGHRTDGSNTYGATMIAPWSWDRLEAAVEEESLLPERAERTRTNRNSGCPVSRYSSFNFNSVLTYGSVEVRLLGNTLNPIKVRAWVETLQAMFNATKAGVEFPAEISTAAELTAFLVSVGHLAEATAAKFNAEVARRLAA